ncbi:LCP family protein [Calidifontibacter terrae]
MKWVMIPLVILALWVGSLLWAANSAWNKVAKVDAMPTDNRPAGGKGTNVLLVGSDSRAGLTTAQIHEYGAGGEGTSRTDSIMILHMGSGNPVLLSIPRDSYVDIPGHRKNKINAAFSIGGPKLLIQTVEQATGLKMDNYMEIGFGGFAGVVDAVGGVRMCLPEAVNDSFAHINLPKGCQTLNGQQSLGYVRSRHAFAEGDLARVKHQREFLAALMAKVASPSNLLVPWKLKGVGESGAQGLAVDKAMSPWTALKTAWTLKGVTKAGQSIQIPIANAAYQTSAGEAVLWNDAKAKVLFDALRNDQSPNVQP